MTRAGLIVLAGALAVLAAIDAGLWWSGESRLARIEAPPPPPRAAPDRLPAAEDTGPTADAVSGWLATAMARPLMTASRRPAASGGAAVALTDGLPRLAGTLFRTDGGVAIFARTDAAHALILRVGGTLGAYRVSRIAPNAVTLDGPGGRQIVHPRFGTARGANEPDGFIPPPVNMPGVMPQFPGVLPQGPGQLPLFQPPANQPPANQ